MVAFITYIGQVSLLHRDTMNPPIDLSSGDKRVEQYTADVLKTASAMCRIDPAEATSAINLAGALHTFEGDVQQLDWLFEFGYPDSRNDPKIAAWMKGQFDGSTSEMSLVESNLSKLNSESGYHNKLSEISSTVAASMRSLDDKIRHFITVCETVRKGYRDIPYVLDPGKQEPNADALQK
jgi:hypothetical protein